MVFYERKGTEVFVLSYVTVATQFSRKKGQGYEMNKKSLAICRNKTFIKTNSLKQVTGIEVPVCRTV